MVERLLEWTAIRPDESRNLIGKELTLEANDKDLMIQFHPKEEMLEISDFEGSFGIWFKVTNDKIEKFKQIIKDMGP